MGREKQCDLCAPWAVTQWAHRVGGMCKKPDSQTRPNATCRNLPKKQPSAAIQLGRSAYSLEAPIGGPCGMSPEGQYAVVIRR